MTIGQGQRIILTSGVLTMGTETLKIAFTDQSYSARLFIGGGIAFTLMAGVAEVAPGPAAVLAATVAVTVFLTDGATVMTTLLNVGGRVDKSKGKGHG